MLAGLRSQEGEQQQSQANSSVRKVTKTVKMKAKKIPIAESNLENSQPPQSRDTKTDKIPGSSVTSTSSNSLEKEIDTTGIDPTGAGSQRIRNFFLLTEGEATLACIRVPFQGTQIIWDLELYDRNLTMWRRELDFQCSSGDRIVSVGLMVPPGPTGGGTEFTSQQENEVSMEGNVAVTSDRFTLPNLPIPVPFPLYIDRFTVKC